MPGWLTARHSMRLDTLYRLGHCHMSPVFHGIACGSGHVIPTSTNLDTNAGVTGCVLQLRHRIWSQKMRRTWFPNSAHHHFSSVFMGHGGGCIYVSKIDQIGDQNSLKSNSSATTRLLGRGLLPLHSPFQGLSIP